MEVQGADIEGGEDHPAAGVEIQERILVEPLRDDKLVVNGVELTLDSTLAALQAGLTFYNLSTSGNASHAWQTIRNNKNWRSSKQLHIKPNDVREPQAPIRVPPR